MWVIGTVWAGVAAMFLIAQATSWAMEETHAQPFGPHQFKMNQLLTPERVIDANPATPGIRGNNVPNLQRWNTMLLQASHNELRQQGPGSSPSGKIVSPDHQNLQSQIGRIGE